jgi:D-alanine-D-alanine ligase
MKLTVLLGGDSDERDVSLATGAQVAQALREAGHEVVAFDTATCEVLGPEEEARLRSAGVAPTPPAPGVRDRIAAGEIERLTGHPVAGRADVHVVALHGGGGEDGTIQGVLERAGCVYTGSDRVGCLLAMDKDLTKRLLRDAGVPTPRWATDELDADRLEAEVGLPLVLKAAGGGSSLRLELVHDRAELEAALERARGWGDHVVSEAYIRGREFTVGVVGGEALPVGEIIPEHELFDYACKYQPGLAREIFPAEVDRESAARMQALALDVHRILRLRDYSRVDFMMDGEGGVWCLEANTVPGMTANSLLPRAARAAGVRFPDLCDRIVQLAAARRNSPSPSGV